MTKVRCNTKSLHKSYLPLSAILHPPDLQTRQARTQSSQPRSRHPPSSGLVLLACKLARLDPRHVRVRHPISHRRIGLQPSSYDPFRHSVLRILSSGENEIHNLFKLGHRSHSLDRSQCARARVRSVSGQPRRAFSRGD